MKRILVAALLMFSMLASFSVAQAMHLGPDSVITAKVIEALTKEMPDTPDGMRSSTIDVYTANGVVTLRGTMLGLDHVKMATEIVKKVEGVKSVKNNISIQRTGK